MPNDDRASGGRKNRLRRARTRRMSERPALWQCQCCELRPASVQLDRSRRLFGIYRSFSGARYQRGTDRRQWKNLIGVSRLPMHRASFKSIKRDLLSLLPKLYIYKFRPSAGTDFTLSLCKAELTACYFLTGNNAFPQGDRPHRMPSKLRNRFRNNRANAHCHCGPRMALTYNPSSQVM